MALYTVEAVSIMLEPGLRLAPGVTLGRVRGRVPPSRSWPAPAMEIAHDLGMSGSLCVRYLHGHGTIACMPDGFGDELLSISCGVYQTSSQSRLWYDDLEERG